VSKVGADVGADEFERPPLFRDCETSGTNEDINSIYVVASLAASAWGESLAGWSKLRPTAWKVRLSSQRYHRYDPILFSNRCNRLKLRPLARVYREL